MDPKQREIIAYMRMEEFRWAVERERVLREAVRRRRQTRRLQGRRAVASPEPALEPAPNQGGAGAELTPTRWESSARRSGILH